MSATKLAWHIIQNPPERYKAHLGGAKGYKVVGSRADIGLLNSFPDTALKIARLMEAGRWEDEVRAAKETGDLSLIPHLAYQLADSIQIIAMIFDLERVWWETCLNEPEASEWVAQWNVAMIEQLRARNLRSVAFNAAVGTPQVKPYDTPEEPDEWAVMYPMLQAIHDAGPEWSMLGLHEYIPDGGFNLSDLSSVGRYHQVYKYHILPNGWNIKTVITEGGFDNPPMLDVPGMNPEYALNQIRQVDAAVAFDPRIAAYFLYTVVNIDTNPDQGGYAFTPGEPATKNHEATTSYLEEIETYILANPPSSEEVPVPTPPPSEPPVEVPPPADDEPKIIYVNHFDSFDYYQTAEDLAAADRGEYFGERKIPVGMLFGSKHGASFANIHVEFYPPSELADAPTAIRFQWMGKGNVWLYKTLDVEIGKLYRFTVKSSGKVIDGEGGVLRSATIDTQGGDDPTGLPIKISTNFPDDYTLVQEVLALTTKMSFFWQVFSNLEFRINADLSLFQIEELRSIVVLPPPPPPPVPDKQLARVGNSSLYVRSAPKQAPETVVTVLAATAPFVAGKEVMGTNVVGGQMIFVECFLAGCQIGYVGKDWIEYL